MLREHRQPCVERTAFRLGCPRAGHGCGEDRTPVSLAAGWDLVQRDWGLRQHEAGPSRAVQRAGALVMRIARLIAAWVLRGRHAAARRR